MPTLEWIGKDKVINHHLEVPFRTLERKYSYDENGQHLEDNGSENMIIHGDNLEALKSLLPRFEGKIKCIYIDPPYNTGNEKWVYNDNVNDPKIRKWLGEVVGKEGEDLSRHDKWLCMMYPRLKLLQKLMADDGVIFISIDEHEYTNLKMIGDEIFGSSNFVATIVWQKTYSPRNDSQKIPYETDYIVVYRKTAKWIPLKLERTEEMDARYKSPDNDTQEWKSGDATAPGAADHQGMVYAIQHPITGRLLYPSVGRHWKDAQEQILDIMNEWSDYKLCDIGDEEMRAHICGISKAEVRGGVRAIMLSSSLDMSAEKAKKRYQQGKWPLYYFTSKGAGGIAFKVFVDEDSGKSATTLWKYDNVGHTDEAKKELKAIFEGKDPFPTPKPLRLLEQILRIASKPGDIVLDSFAGSGVTAHAVLKTKKEFPGRKFILVELEDYAETLTAERVKRAINGYSFKGSIEETIYSEKLTLKKLSSGEKLLKDAEEAIEKCKADYDKISKPKIQDQHLIVTGTKKFEDRMPGLGGNFSFYELGEPLLIDGKLNARTGVNKIREYIWFTETKEAFSEPVNPDNKAFLGSFAETAYYFYYDSDSITTLDHDFLGTIKKQAAGYVIYADLCALSAEELKRFGIVFKKIPRDITKL